MWTTVYLPIYQHLGISLSPKNNCLSEKKVPALIAVLKEAKLPNLHAQDFGFLESQSIIVYCCSTALDTSST